LAEVSQDQAALAWPEAERTNLLAAVQQAATILAFSARSAAAFATTPRAGGSFRHG